LNRSGDTERGRIVSAREEAAIEMVERHESALRRAARRLSIDAEDADDAYQRALEIVLTKAPTTDQRELIRWTHTVIKHEALAVRRNRERLLGPPPPEWLEGAAADPLATLPSRLEGPAEQVERREEVARAREALRTLKPAELRALSLLAEGYSYAEICKMTGFTHTKVNRVLAEGRSRFRELVSSSEDGRRCRELRPLLSAFCDGEASLQDSETVREHLRACASCRATMRAFRAAPGLASVLLPAPLASRSLLGRLHDLLARAGSHLSGTTKLIAATAAGTAAGVTVAVLPTPLPQHPSPARPAAERIAGEPAQAPSGGEKRKRRRPEHRPRPTTDATTAEAPVAEPVEYEAPPPPPPAEPVSGSESSGSAAGEFGP